MAKTTLQVSIPEPCHEDWAKMTPTQCGAFCQACQKEVVDFSRMSEAEIVDRLSKASGKVCGRIPTTMLNRELVKHEPDHAWYSWKKWAVAAGVMLGVGDVKGSNSFVSDTTSKLRGDTATTLPDVKIVEYRRLPQGSEVMGATFYRHESIVENLSIHTSITLSGRVTDENGEPLAMASISVSIDSSIGVLSNEEGYYSIVLPKAFNSKVVQVRSTYLGYDPFTFTWIAEENKTQNIQFTAREEPAFLGVIIQDKPRHKIRRFFRRIGNAFRKPENRY